MNKVGRQTKYPFRNGRSYSRFGGPIWPLKNNFIQMKSPWAALAHPNENEYLVTFKGYRNP
jgi:hypothetical protein